MGNSTISSSNNIVFSYIKSPLNKYTFKPPKIRQWVEERCKDKDVLNLFAGFTELRYCIEWRNDLDKNVSAHWHKDALDCVKWLMDLGVKFSVILIDPPYSYRKSMELYHGYRNSRFKQILDILPKILKPDGKVIIFGYCASYMGKVRGFKIDEILVIDHSGAQHATLAVVESRI